MYEKQAGEIPCSLCERKCAVLTREYEQQNVEKGYANSGQDMPANQTGRRWSALPQLRNAQSHSQGGIVDEQHLVTRKSSPESLVAEKMPVSGEVIKRIAKKHGRKRRKDRPESTMSLPVAQKSWIVEELN